MTEHGQRLLDIMIALRTAVTAKEQTVDDKIFCPRMVYLERWNYYGWNCSDCVREFKPIYPNQDDFIECPCFNIGTNLEYQITREALVNRLNQVIHHIGENM